MIKVYSVPLIFIWLFLSAFPSEAVEVFSQFPDQIDPDGRYVFYSHGFIVEGDDPTPEHPRWGVYDFPKIKQALSDPSYKLIAYHRPKGTDTNQFAGKLDNDVSVLIANGVKPSNIFLIGFSRGGVITIFSSSMIANKNVSFIILAGCGPQVQQHAKLYGQILSIVETSDDLVGSCKPVINRSQRVNRFSEISIATGKEHEAFYQPLADWVDPIKAWINEN